MEYPQDYHSFYNRVRFILFAVAFTLTNAYSQTLKNQNIGTLGNSIVLQNGFTFRSVVGQPANINLRVLDNTPVSQGFIHPQANKQSREKSTRNLNMKIFPNPSNNIFHIEAALKPGDRIEVRNILGMIVFSEPILNSVPIKSIDISFCVEGLYTLSVFGVTEHLQTKLIEIIK
jgi:hypothetical protein